MWSTIIGFIPTVWKGLKGWSSKNKLSAVLIAVVLLLAGILYVQYKNASALKKELAVVAHNLEVAKDSIRVTKDKEGKDEFNKLAYLTDQVSKLQELNAELYKEVKSIKGKVATITKAQVQIVTKEVPLVVKGELIDSTVTTDFSFDSTYSAGNFRKLKGFNKYDLRTGLSSGVLTKDEIGMTFTTGIKNADIGKPEIFLKSDYPGFTVTQLSGAVLDPKLFSKQKVPLVTVGAQIGYIPINYDLSGKSLDFTPRVGVSLGVHVNLIRAFQK